MTKYMFYAYMKCNDEKTGDTIVTLDQSEAEEYFAQKKQIPVEDWKKIYYVLFVYTIKKTGSI